MISKTVKSLIKPAYRSLRKVVSTDRPSGWTIGTFSGCEVAYRKGTSDEDVIAESLDRDIYFSGVPEYQPKEDDTIIDVGAHIGAFVLRASRKVPRGRVFAIEPCGESVNLLKINIALNRLDNVSIHHAALAESDGVCTLNYSQCNWGHSTVARRLRLFGSNRSETVPAMSLSGFLSQNSIAGCAFMKMNCEGAEFPILLATPAEVLARFGCMLILYHSDIWTRNSVSDLVSHLERSGFDCSFRNKVGKRGWIIACRRRKA